MLKILFTYPEVVSNEINLINHLMIEWDYLHVKKKDMDADELANYLELIDEQHHKSIMLHDHFELVKEFDLGGLAFNRDNLFLHNQYQDAKRSYSAHSLEEISALRLPMNYIFLSPIYSSISKNNYGPSFVDREKLKNDLKGLDDKVIALGGVKEEKHEELESLGFAGYAMLGGIWEKHLQVKEWG